jgi:Pyruvate/2-oxoacid:ferredoxin oxidoreductase gamma subunit
VLIGVLIGATSIVSKEVVIASLAKKFKEKSPKIMEINIAAIEKGIELGSKA